MPQDDQEESIYNLIAPPRQVRARSSMHKSRYPHDTPPTASTFVTQRFATCNISNVAGNYRPAQPNTPSNYLYGHPDVSTLPPSPHKRAAQVLSAPRPFHYTDRRKEELHDHLEGEVKQKLESAEVPLKTGKPRKNFIAENAIRAITMKPPRDNKVEWQENYLKRPGFGQVPAYLNKVKEDIAMEKRQIAEYLARQQEARQPSGPPMRAMEEEERQALLTSLKQKWEEVNRAYQTMTHMVTLDTFGKIRRKEQYEQQLDELERSIEKLSKKVVYVYDDTQY